MENNSTELKIIEQEFANIIKKLDIMCFNKKISEYTKSMLNDMTRIVIKNITEKYEKVKKGLGDIMGGKVLEYEAKTILKEGIEQGIEHGVKQGMEKALVFMVVKKIKKGKDVGIIADELEETPEKISKIFYAALESAPDYDIDKICGILNQKPGNM